MWWLQHLNFVLIVGFAILSATDAESPRDKRDLSLIKKLIRLAIFGNENKTAATPINNDEVRLFRIPGYGNVLVEAIPKVTEVVPKNLEVIPISVADQQRVSLAALCLGTHSNAETLKALQGMKLLLHSGILSTKKEIPHLQFVDIGTQRVERPHILFDTPIYDNVQVKERPVIFEHHPLLSIFRRPIPFSNVVGPIPAPIPVLQPKYSYKQVHGDGRVTSYTSKDGHNVDVTESDRPVPVPPFVTHGIKEAMNIGAQSVLSIPKIPLSEIHYRNPDVHYLDTLKLNYPPIRSPSNYFYKQIHKDGTATSYSSDMTGDVVVSQTDKLPPIPGFITDRIEKVAATAVTGKQPNVDVLIKPNVGQMYYYNQPINAFPMIDVFGGVQVKVDSKEQQKVNLVSKGTYSYQTIHNDGKVTNHLNEPSVTQTPIAKVEAKPISPAFTENRLGSITQANGGSFSYKILHSDGSVTNYGVFGVHGGVNGEKKIVPFDKTTPIFQANLPKLYQEGSVGSLNYKIVHNDGSVSSYSSSGVSEEKGPSIPVNGHNSEGNNLLNEAPKRVELIENNINLSSEHVIPQDIVKGTQRLPGSFSYKAIHNDGSMTIYSQNGVTEVYGKQNENEIDKIKTNEPNVKVNEQVSPLTNVSPHTGSFSYKTIQNDGMSNGQTDFKDKDQNQETLRDRKIVGSAFTYKTIHNDGSETNYPGDSKEFIKVSNNNAAITTENANFEDTKLHTNLQSTENSLRLHTDKAVLSGVFDDESKHNNESTKTTEVIPPAPELHEITSNVLTDNPAGIRIADSNKLPLTKPIVSSYSYKQINHNQPRPHHDQATVAVNIGEAASKIHGPVATSGQTNKGATVDIISKNYIYIPPETINEPRPIGDPKVVKNIAKENPPSVVVFEPVEDVTCVEKLSEHPIVVLDEPMHYSYEQRKVDGSAVIVESDQNVVSVTISPKQDYAKRGEFIVADSNELPLTKPIVSSYTYKQINHNQPDQVTVAVNIGEAASKLYGPVATSSQTNKGATVDIISKDYIYIPPENINDPLPIGNPKAVKNIAKENPPSVVVFEPVEDGKRGDIP